MLFSSLEFLFLFLPICLISYFLFPRRLRNLVLLIFSLIFYAFGEPLYLFLMLLTLLCDWLFGIMIEKRKKDRRNAKTILIIAVVFNLSLLGVFKYGNTFLGLIRQIPAFSGVPQVDIPLPVGISFYTFQSLSYVVDVYREKVESEKDPLIPALYVTLFPQLIAGPIVKYGDIREELKSRSHSAEKAAEGIRRFAVGLSKKVLLANTAGEMWEDFAISLQFGSDTLYAWLGIIFFSFQIYFDFSGYSDMAIGLGKLFGFSLPENFDHPYLSKSITEFWRRWHITLSSFFREYLYIPLGGNRKGSHRTYLNLFIVWSLTGLWHGSSVNFLLWGIYYFLILWTEKAILLKLLKKLPTVFSHSYTLIMIAIGWLIFASDGTTYGFGLSEALKTLRTLFGVGVYPLFTPHSLYILRKNLVLLIIMAVGSTDIPRRLSKQLLEKKPLPSLISLNILSLCGIFLSVAYLVNSGYNPFLYFKF